MKKYLLISRGKAYATADDPDKLRSWAKHAHPHWKECEGDYEIAHTDEEVLL